MRKFNYPEHYAKNAWSAIKLAEELKAAGEYDLFRGQRHTFEILPSVLRDGVDKKVAATKLNEFTEWVRYTPELSSLHHNFEAILAVAQHYGLKTPLLDFTYSPEIAGFFATDGGVKGDTGTIICVNKERFVKSWQDINDRHHKQQKLKLTEIMGAAPI